MESQKTCWCGNNQLSEFSPDYWVCSQCGSLVSKEGLADEETQVKNDEADFYGKEYWLSHQTEDYGFPDIYQRARQDLTDRCIYWLQTLLKYKLPPANVLELGCSHGGSVALVKWAGFAASGLEMSPWVVEFAQKTFDVPMYVGRVEDQQIEPESLDAIVLYDVLEHLPDPLATMDYCLSLLKPDGIFIVQMPNYQEGKPYSEMVEQNDQFLEQLKPIEHLHLFNYRATQQFFERLGVHHLQFEPALFAYDMYFVASRQPLVQQSSEAIEKSLLDTTSGRLVLALLDQTNEFHQLQASHQELLAKYQASESDRADRLKVIDQQGQDLADLQAAMHHGQSVIEQYQTQLESALDQLSQSRNELQQVYVHLDYSQSQLQNTQTQLQNTQNQLQNTETQLQTTETQLQNTQNQFERSQARVDRQKARLEALQAELETSQAEIEFMKASNFWKLRNRWFKLKKALKVGEKS